MKKNKLLQKTISKLVEASFKEGRILESQVIKSVKALKSLPNTDAIWTLSEYLKELKRKQRQYTLYIETAIPITQTQLQNVRKILERKVKITKTVINVNPKILGGFKIRIGDNVWDESILGKINQVKEEIISGRSNQAN